MLITASQVSCGIKQLYGIAGDDSTWKPRLKVLEPMIYGARCDCDMCKKHREELIATGQGLPPSCRFLIFSDADCFGNGIRFARYLEDQGLGKPTEVCTGINPNSHNKIRLWSWEVPYYFAFKKYLESK